MTSCILAAMAASVLRRIKARSNGLRRSPPERAQLFEQLFRRDRDAIDDLARPIEDLQHFVTQRTAKFTLASAARGQFDPAVTGIASRANHVTFLMK